MRWTRPLLLIAILAIAAGVGATFYNRLREQNTNSPAKPAVLPAGINGTAQDWSYTQKNSGKPVVTVHAKDYREVDGKYLLTGVLLQLYQKDATEYDLVKSAKAEFDIGKGVLYSEGEVEITMNVPTDEEPSGRLMSIKSSGLTFESKTGKATTDRAAIFGFDRGDGKCVGASYDPQTHELHMYSQVELNWRGSDPDSKPMHVETAELIYKEKEAKVYLAPWSKLVRDTLTLNAGPAVVQLADGMIQQVDTTNAEGADHRPGRNIAYAADTLAMNFDDEGEVKHITGEKNAKLVSTSDTSETTITGNRVDLDFDTSSGDSALDVALASGHAVLESKPIPKPGVQPPETKILRSDIVRTKMRPGGQEVDNIETEVPGSLEFVPNRPDQSHRFMNGDRFWVTYGPKNQIDTLKSVQVTTRTEKPRPANAKEDPAPALTWSKDLKASFDPKTAQLAHLEQWNDFRYEEGPRKAKAVRASLDQDRNLIDLSGAARVWDATGSTDGDHIIMDQKSGDFSAEGHVNSTRMPDKKKDSNSGGMLAEDEPLHAKANKMVSKDNNLQVRYEGNAIAWQGTNRLEGDVIEIDRDNNNLKAHGHVVSQLVDKKKDDNKPGADAPRKTDKPASAPVFTLVQAPDLVYNDDDRLAIYTGGVTLDRGPMKVKSKELRAYLRDSDEDSSLDHAFADGAVEVVQTSAQRKRTSASEHAEYYVNDNKVVLSGGHPQLVDSYKGTTKGTRLTWFSDDDKLIVEGADGEPTHSKLRRK